MLHLETGRNRPRPRRQRPFHPFKQYPTPEDPERKRRLEPRLPRAQAATYGAAKP
jgi:hypothetical protein